MLRGTLSAHKAFDSCKQEAGELIEQSRRSIEKLVRKTGRPTVFSSAKWLSNNRQVFGIDLEFMKDYHQNSQMKGPIDSYRVASLRESLTGFPRDRDSLATASIADQDKRSDLRLGQGSADRGLGHKSKFGRPRELTEGNQSLPSSDNAFMRKSDAWAQKKIARSSNTFSNNKHKISIEHPVPNDCSLEHDREVRSSLQTPASRLLNRTEHKASSSLPQTSKNSSQTLRLPRNQSIEDEQQKQDFGSHLDHRRNKDANSPAKGLDSQHRKVRSLGGSETVVVSRKPQYKKLSKREFQFGKKKSQKYQDLFEDFARYEKELNRKGIYLEPRRTETGNNIVMLNKAMSSNWPEVAKINMMHSREVLTAKTQKAVFEKEKQLVCKRMNHILHSNLWNLKEQVSNVLADEKALREKKRHFQSSWAALLLAHKLIPAMKEKMVLFKVVEIFKQAKQARFERVVALAKKYVQSKYMPAKQDKTLVLCGDSVRFVSAQLRNKTSHRAEIFVAHLFWKLAQPLKLVNSLLVSHRLLLKMVRRCTNFFKKVRAYRLLVRKPWEEAKTETLNSKMETFPQNSKLLALIEDAVLKFLYDYFDCYKVVETMNALQANASKPESVRFSSENLHRSLKRPDRKLINDIIINCLTKHLESSGKDESKKAKTKEALNSLTSLVPSMSGLKLKSITSPSKAVGKDGRKDSAASAQKFSFTSITPAKPATNNPFMQLSLMRHVDKKLMISIQTALFERPTEIRAFWLRYKN